MFVFNDVQDILPVLNAPAVKITLLRISSQIYKTTLAATLTGKRLFHNLSLFASVLT
jgi:hypothetical protein